ncbi:hypothetical protein [Paenibacillus sp. QZ-Y1]|uniref:hypothetical protein n=1 Tax=Paenibacillus sp. QZ-Y1 TaxID=3414511 RepID=UPI003F7AA14A
MPLANLDILLALKKIEGFFVLYTTMHFQDSKVSCGLQLNDLICGKIVDVL